MNPRHLKPFALVASPRQACPVTPAAPSPPRCGFFYPPALSRFRYGTAQVPGPGGNLDNRSTRAFISRRKRRCVPVKQKKSLKVTRGSRSCKRFHGTGCTGRASDREMVNCLRSGPGIRSGENGRAPRDRGRCGAWFFYAQTGVSWKTQALSARDG